MRYKLHWLLSAHGPLYTLSQLIFRHLCHIIILIMYWETFVQLQPGRRRLLQKGLFGLLLFFLSILSVWLSFLPHPFLPLSLFSLPLSLHVFLVSLTSPFLSISLWIPSSPSPSPSLSLSLPLPPSPSPSFYPSPFFYLYLSFSFSTPVSIPLPTA